MKTTTCTALVCAGLMALAFPLGAQQTKKPKPSTGGGIETAVLVLDASGSMNSSIDGQSKMTIAKDAVRTLVSSWDKNVPLGLTVYGHRSGGCTDIESLIPVQPVDPTAFMTTVDALSAGGSTPLTEAVIQAAEQLDYEHNQATVILVSDGEESCGGDPCEMATQLEKLGVDLTVHVVGFGVTDDDGLACIAKNTGGQYKKAADAAELKSALGGMVKDVEVRKKRWRKRWGKRWGKNGRWVRGRWKQGRHDGHKGFWAQYRAKWKKHPKKPRRAKQPPPKKK